METRRVDPSKYVVLDVETNGLSSIRDDLLSISIFKPDSGEIYNRFLPLEMNPAVITTRYNGIRTEDLVGLLPLSQDEVDEIIRVYDLKNRTVLTYGALDERFMVKYFHRHHLQGIECFAFYNFKHEIISSKYSEGNVTKDNLCNLYEIEDVKSVHTGSNDCVLEWKLFEHMNGHRLLVTDNKVFEFNNEYIVPVSFIYSHPNLKYYLPSLPRIACESRIVFSLPLIREGIKKFPTNFNGMILEHIINSMLTVKKVNSQKVLLENKKKLKYIGKLPSSIDIIPMVFNPDGSMTATRPQDQKMVERINAVVDVLKAEFEPLIDFIANTIFSGQEVKSQELVVHSEEKILALCDLSNENAVLEIKATSHEAINNFAEQLYYEANGRKCFVLMIDWDLFPQKIIYNIHEIEFKINECNNFKQALFDNARKKIETEDIKLISYLNVKKPVMLKCKNCGNEWISSYNNALKHSPCPMCHKSISSNGNRAAKTVHFEDTLTPEERSAFNKFMRCKLKIERRSNHQITLVSYKDSKTPAKVKCLVCGNEWEDRFDHILARPNCRTCNVKNTYFE